jgi:cell division protein FtsB
MKKAVFVLIVLVLLFIINGLAHSIYDLWHKQDLLTSAQRQLSQEKLKNQKLKGELSYVKSPQFIEEQAHNKLFLVKPGEQEILISQSLKNKNQPQGKNQNTANWQKWLNLFF